MTVPEILVALDQFHTEIPREALAAAVAQREAVTPELLRALEEAVRDPAPLIADQRRQLHVYALYLLAHFRETRAYPAFLKLWALPGETTIDLTGYLLAEEGSKLLASVHDGNIEPIKRLFEDEQVNLALRAKALETLAVLVLWGERGGPEVFDYLRSQFRRLTLGSHPALGALLTETACNLRAIELREDILKAFRDGFVRPETIDPTTVSTALYGDGRVQLQFARRSQPVYDVAEAVSWWGCFKKPASGEAETASTASHPAGRIGRNDSCPCGSGRKFKKCCGARPGASPASPG